MRGICACVLAGVCLHCVIHRHGVCAAWLIRIVLTGLPLFLIHLLQVSIDANGVLKVTHLVPLAAQRGRAAPLASSWAATPAMSAAFGGTSNTQAGGASSQGVAVVQFVSLPVEEDD